MRLSTRMVERPQVSAREQWRRDRAAALPMHTVFPSVASLQFDLRFEDCDGVSPVGQRHILHRAASAFFEFLCPYTNCSGKFDLAPLARVLVHDSSTRTTGSIVCAGHRSRDGVTSPPCAVRLVYVMEAAYLKSAEQV